MLIRFDEGLRARDEGEKTGNNKGFISLLSASGNA